MKIDGIYLLNKHMVVDFNLHGDCEGQRLLNFQGYRRSSMDLPLELDALEMPEGTRILRKLPGDERIGYVWSNGRLQETPLKQQLKIQ
mgnify:FL=1